MPRSSTIFCEPLSIRILRRSGQGLHLPTRQSLGLVGLEFRLRRQPWVGTSGWKRFRMLTDTTCRREKADRALAFDEIRQAGWRANSASGESRRQKAQAENRFLHRDA